jgi:hypothetical protein
MKFLRRFQRKHDRVRGYVRLCVPCIRVLQSQPEKWIPGVLAVVVPPRKCDTVAQR